MPGILEIIEDVAADPAVESSVAKLVGGLFGHLKDLLSTGNTAAVEQAVNDGMQKAPDMVAAVLSNTPTPPAPGGAAAAEVHEEDTTIGGQGEDTGSGAGA